MEVSEEGTEAAATTIIKGNRGNKYPTKEIHVKNPFMYFIKHRSSGVILFMGRVVCPDPEQCRDSGNTLPRLDDPGATDRAAAGTAHCQGLACEDEAITQPGTENGGLWTKTPPEYNRASIGESGTKWSVVHIVWLMSYMYLSYTVHN